ncbi:MAG TPA: S41 family peptidase [Longimicrobium sp.]|nr:S41 family peptidase [Longimicrobium sp.]
MNIRTRILRAAVAAGCLLLLAPTLGAQIIPAHDRARGRTMLRQVRAQIEQHYYDPTFNGLDLDAREAHADSIIQHATSLGEMLAAIAALTRELGDSHTFFIPPWQTVTASYGWDMMIVGDSAFVTFVAARSDAERQGVRVGDRVLAVNGHAPTRANLWSMFYVFRALSPQPGLRVVMRAPGGEPRQLDLAARVRRRSRIMDLTGAGAGQDIHTLIREAQNEADAMRPRFAQVGDVLVWKLPTFFVDDEQIRGGLRRARRGRALVLDLRDNGGGPIDRLLALLGGLRPDSVLVGMERERTGMAPLMAAGGGADAFTGEVVVLVDSRSASASEVMARVVQLTGRGMVMGDRTSGAVSRGRFEVLEMGVDRVMVYGVMVGDAQLLMADGGNLEGVGVLPDTVILPTAVQLAAGDDPVLAEALTFLGVPTDPAAAGALFPKD